MIKLVFGRTTWVWSRWCRHRTCPLGGGQRQSRRSVYFKDIQIPGQLPPVQVSQLLFFFLGAGTMDERLFICIWRVSDRVIYLERAKKNFFRVYQIESIWVHTARSLWSGAECNSLPFFFFQCWMYDDSVHRTCPVFSFPLLFFFDKWSVDPEKKNKTGGCLFDCFFFLDL